MTETHILNIGGYECPPPIEMGFEYNDLDSSNSGRNESGIMTRERVRQGVLKLSPKWTMLTTEEATDLLNSVSSDSFSVSWSYGDFSKSATMYCSSQTGSWKYLTSSNDVRWEISFNLIEY